MLAFGRAGRVVGALSQQGLDDLLAFTAENLGDAARAASSAIRSDVFARATSDTMLRGLIHAPVERNPARIRKGLEMTTVIPAGETCFRTTVIGVALALATTVAQAQIQAPDRGRPSGERRVEHMAQRPHESRPVERVQRTTRDRAGAALAGPAPRPIAPPRRPGLRK